MKLYALLLALLLLTPAAAAARFPLVGKWFSPDAEERLNDGIIEMYQKNGKYFGKIVWSRRKQPLDVHGDGKSLLGRVILSGFVYDGDNTYTDGKIYNPRDGKTYSCKLEVQQNGKRLRVRGYVLIPLFGRTQYWQRMEKQ